MRISTGIAVAALSGLATAAEYAGVFHLMTSSRRQQIPENILGKLPKEVARHILLQRTSESSGYGSDLRDLPESIDTDAAVSYIARYGKRTLPLFSVEEKSGDAQLVVIIEGVTQENAGPLTERLQTSEQSAGFVIADPPSAAANSHLMDLFRNMGVVPSSQGCDFESAINPFDSSCWAKTSTVLKYDLKKSPETIQTLIDNFPRLTKFVANGDLEATFVLMPESSRSSKINHWSAAAAGNANSEDLRRRQNAETVIADDSVRLAPAATADLPATSQPTKPARIPACFNSLNACTKQTNECSGHGKCINKYDRSGNATASAEPKICFVCSCVPTIVKPGKPDTHVGIKTVQWGGNMCQKKDISVPFWLLTGFTIVLVGAITFAIGLLYSVGSEPLPGVIGAGVIRSSK